MAEVRRIRRVSKPTVFSEEEVLQVTTVYGGEERNRREVLSVRKFMVEPSYVRVNAGMTKNMGNYESLRIDVSISRPCYVEEESNAMDMVASKVSLFLEDELKQYE